MSGIKVNLDGQGMAELLKSDEVRAALTQRAERVLAKAQAEAPVKSGNYKAGLHIDQATTDRAVVRVGSNVPHAHLVEAQSGVLSRALDAAGGS